jgi:hypothetical protein
MRTTLALAILLLAFLTAGSLRAEKLTNGLAFQTPEGWSVKDIGEAALLRPVRLDGDGAELYLVTVLPGVRDLQDPQLTSVQKRYLPLETPVRLAGPPQSFTAANGTGYLYRYEPVSGNVALSMRIYVVGLPGGGVAAVIAIARPSLWTLREAAIATVASSLARLTSRPAPSKVGNSAGIRAEARIESLQLRGWKEYHHGIELC